MPIMARAFWISLFYSFVGMFLVFIHIESSKKGYSKTFGDNVEVIVAKRDIAELEFIDESMLTTTWVPRKFAPPSAATDKKELRGMLALVAVREGDPIVKSAVSPPNMKTGMSTIVPANMRAVSVPVNERSGVANFVKPGDRVDILARLQAEGENGEKRAQMQTILQNVHVLATGQQMAGQPQGEIESDNYNERSYLVAGEKPKYQTLTVEVTPDQAQVLVLAMSEGSEMYFTLRSSIDRLEMKLPPVSKKDLYEDDEKRPPPSYFSQAPAPLPALPQPKSRDWFDPFYWGGGVLELF